MQTPASTIITTGDLGGRKIKMGMAEDAVAKLLNILTDLYSDAEMATIREYATNAWDSHVEAGNTAPIEITTPNALSPYYIIKDYGVGLSVDDIERIYSQYGASTKTGSNNTNGMLGLGAKSALSLVPQFNIISVKGGVKITVMVSRSADGGGQMEVVDTRATDEPNGVEVKIPVPRSYTFAEKVERFFQFWPEGTVLVNGEQPKRITGRPVGDKFIVNKSLGHDYIVMGNVAYPCETLYKDQYGYMGIVAFVEIGDVNFTPSREDLHYTPKTNETIEALRREFKTLLVASAQKDVEESANHAEAWERAAGWRTSFFNRLGQFTYKGDAIPSDISFVKDATDQYGSRIQGKSFNIVGKSGRYANWIRTVNPTILDDHLFVIGFADSLKPSPTQREKVQVYVKNQGWSCTKVVFFKETVLVDDPTHLKFLEGMKIVDWSEINKIKITRVKTPGVVRTEKYDLFNGSRWSYTPVSDFDTTKPIIFISPTENRAPYYLQTIFPEGQIVMLGMNRWDKFKRDWPTAKYHQDAVNNMRASLVAKFTKADRILWNFSNSYDRRQFAHLKADQIIDPDVKDFLNVVNGKAGFSAAAKEARSMGSAIVAGIEIDPVDNPLTRYPLGGTLGEVDSDHAHWYLNTYYNDILSKEN